MADNLVSELRTLAQSYPNAPYLCGPLTESADRIESLEHEVAALKRQAEATHYWLEQR
jgi:hypothetical protein